jgi:hypothetical protein
MNQLKRLFLIDIQNRTQIRQQKADLRSLKQNTDLKPAQLKRFSRGLNGFERILNPVSTNSEKKIQSSIANQVKAFLHSSSSDSYRTRMRTRLGGCAKCEIRF